MPPLWGWEALSGRFKKIIILRIKNEKRRTT